MSSSLINPSLYINEKIAIVGRYFMINLEPMAKNRIKMHFFTTPFMGSGPQRGMKSCRKQGESVHLSVPFQGLAQASQKLAQAL